MLLKTHQFCATVVILQDSFYRGLTAEESERVHEYNFDHPGNIFVEQFHPGNSF